MPDGVGHPVGLFINIHCPSRTERLTIIMPEETKKIRTRRITEKLKEKRKEMQSEAEGENAKKKKK